MLRRAVARFAAAAALMLAAAQSTPERAGPARALKVFTPADGLYEIGPAELAAGGPAWESVQPRRLRLFHHGREVPTWLVEQDDGFRLRFYGQAGPGPYARENVYWLEQGAADARPMTLNPPDRRPSGVLPSVTYTATIHLQQNLLYQPLAREGDRWFWSTLSGPAAQDFTFTVSGLAPGPPHLELSIWVPGGTLGLSISLNAQDLGEYWAGPGRGLALRAIPPGLLREGRNLVRLVPLSGAGPAYLDWIAVQHTRRLTALDDQIDFDGPGGLVRLDGFSGAAAAVDVTQPERAMPAASAEAGSVTFWAEAGHRYRAAGPGGWQRPSRITPAETTPDLRAPGLGASYLAIGPPSLLAPLRPLLDHRAAQGLSVMPVSLQAVFDQFGGGQEGPDALRAYLRYAAWHYQPAPRFVLLVGDTTFDGRGYLAPPAANRLPTYLVDTLYGGETASDVEIARLDADAWPDLALARLPAATPAEVRAYVGKVLAYELQLLEPGRTARVVAVADPSDPVFEAAAQTLLARFEESHDTQLLVGPAAAREALGAGSLWLFYLGHGALRQWGKDRLLHSDDIGSLGNSRRLPVVVHLTCLTGYFIHPQAQSLAEAMVLQPEGGAIAVIAPTSLTVPGDQSTLWRALAGAWLEDPAAPLGSIFLKAQRNLPADTPGQRDLLATFLLFGDPALRLATSRSQ